MLWLVDEIVIKNALVDLRDLLWWKNLNHRLKVCWCSCYAFVYAEENPKTDFNLTTRMHFDSKQFSGTHWTNYVSQTLISEKIVFPFFQDKSELSPISCMSPTCLQYVLKLKTHGFNVQSRLKISLRYRDMISQIHSFF